MKHRNTRAMVGLVAASALAVSLTGCVDSGRSSSADAPDSDCPWDPDTSIETEARIAAQPIANGDAIVRDLGVLENCMPNATIKWQNAASGADVVKYYGTGDIDLGLMGSSPATIVSSAPLVDQVDVDVVWIHDVIGEAESLVVKGDAEDITGLKGKTIAVPFSSTAHYSLLQALTDAGMSPSDVDLINLEPERMVGAWQGDQIDAAWVWDPVQSTLLEDGGTRILSSKDTAEAGRPTFDLGTVDAKFAQENPEFMTQWAKAQDWAVKLIEDDPGKAAESVAVILGIDVEEAEKLFAGMEYLDAKTQAGEEYLGGKMGQDLFTTAKFLADQGGIEQAGPEKQYADHVDAGPAEQVG